MANVVEDSVESIMALTRSASLQKGKFKDFVQELIPLLCQSLNASSASFSLFRKEKNSFDLIQSYDVPANKVFTKSSLDLSQFPSFKEKLKENLFVHLDNSMLDDDVEEFTLDYLLKNRLGSWISMQVWNGNRLFGILAVEWKSKKEMTDRDRLVLTVAASMISQCYDALLRLKEEFLHRNEVSTLKVEEVKKEQLAKKLSDHAFYTSHSVRHPISTILALIDLIKLNWESREAYEELLQQLKIETMNLDDTIRVMTAKIELD